MGLQVAPPGAVPSQKATTDTDLPLTTVRRRLLVLLSAAPGKDTLLLGPAASSCRWTSSAVRTVAELPRLVSTMANTTANMVSPAAVATKLIRFIINVMHSP